MLRRPPLFVLAVLSACASPPPPAIGNTVPIAPMPVPRTGLPCDGAFDGTSAAGVHGLVTSQTTGDALEGVTVVVTTNRGDPLPGSPSVRTDHGGCYFVGNLPAGKFGISFYYLDVAVGRFTVLARGKVERLDGQIPVETSTN